MTPLPDILARIVEHKRGRPCPTDEEREAVGRRAAEALSSRRDFAGALRRAPAVVAEIKQASPSRGVLAEEFDPAAIARDYERGGAAALSVLTDEKFFRGSLDDLAAARAATRLPVLRKDFTLDEFDVVEAAAAGADAILLIAAILDAAALRRLRERAKAYRMAAIVEVHDEEELRAAIDSGAEIAGVNNRDLRTFEVRLGTSLRLAGRIPAGVLRLAESGIFTAGDVRLLRDAGYEAFLVGESLMTAPDRAAAVRALLG
jgi:indole-3-glycerol phosphate synthase